MDCLLSQMIDSGMLRLYLSAFTGTYPMSHERGCWLGECRRDFMQRSCQLMRTTLELDAGRGCLFVEIVFISYITTSSVQLS